MLDYSLVMGYQEAVDFFAQRILDSKEKQFVATVEGIPGIGKTHFFRNVSGIIGFKKQGTVTKLQDLERELQQNLNLDFYLIERGEYDTLYELTEREIKRQFNKKPDFRILMVSDIAIYLDPPKISLEKLTEVFQLIVNNPYIFEQE